MAAYNKYQVFVEDLGRKVHNLNADTLKVALTNTAPNAATHAGLADITEIAAGNGYAAGGAALPGTTWAQTGGTAKLASTGDVTFTAAGGTIGPFRYVVVYNDTSTGDRLLGYYDRGAALTLQDGESYTPDMDNTQIISLA